MSTGRFLFLTRQELRDIRLRLVELYLKFPVQSQDYTLDVSQMVLWGTVLISVSLTFDPVLQRLKYDTFR